MRINIAVCCLLGCLSCGTNESDLPPFTIRLTPEGGTATYLTGSQLDIDLGLCGATTGTCDRGGLHFYPDAGNGSFTAPLSLVLSANNIPVTGGRVTPGTYQFDDITPIDIFAQFNSHEGDWGSRAGKLIISTSTATRLSGSISFTGYDASVNQRPPIEVDVRFDFLIPH